MKPRNRGGFGIVVVLFIASLCFPALGKPARQRMLLDADWSFHRGALPGASLDPQGRRVELWRWRTDPAAGANAARMADPALDTADWTEAATGQEVFGGAPGFAWFRATLPEAPRPDSPVLHFEGVDDNATVYLNGKELARHEGWNDPFEVNLKPAWRTNGPNILAVLVENTGGGGGIMGPVLFRSSELYPAPAPAALDYDDSTWTRVHLPHDFVIEGTFDPKGDANHGSILPTNGWYRKVFSLPASAQGKCLWLDFDGTYRNSMVWLNGHFLGRHQSGYTSYRYDISQCARYGQKNVLVVFVDPRTFEGWWYEGGGLYRHVWLNVAEAVHLAPWGTFVTTHLPEPVEGAQPSPAQVTVQSTIANDSGSAAEVTLRLEVVDEQGSVVARTVAPARAVAGQPVCLTNHLMVARPQLWSIETPHLYRLRSSVQRGRQIGDRTETEFGIRTIRFDAERGFFLNGKPVKIQGTCNHQDFAGVGVAVPDTLEYWRVRKLKEMGANAWRMSHNPPNPELLEACDRLGMLVMDENRHLGNSASILEEVAELVLRDRNHPSIIMWSLCNEESRQGTEQGTRLFSAMMEVVRRHDPTRPISSAMNAGWLEPVNFGSVEDLVGVNYSPGQYDAIHQHYPSKPMFGSETASTLTTRGEYADNQEKTFVTSYNLTEGAWKPVAERPFVAGGFVWTGFDYKGEPTPYGWPCINSHFGILDICGFPKDNYYYYLAWWKTNPVLHILPHWNWPGKAGQEIKVVVFSNCERIELFCNGQSLGTQDMLRNSHLEWRVKYAPGSLLAKGYNAGRVAGTDVVETTGAPAALRLKTDRPLLAANGEDLALVEVDVVDAQGRIVPVADNRVSFSIQGPGHIAGVGNGNPGDHDPDKASSRRAFNGKCLVLVGSGERSGAIRLTATADGLPPATLALRAKR
ncbi:MAG TPA: beta-galactosidase GalA [Bacillota bacterium]|nr:beta-galactosidase GalA [Bacillota bacterium]